MNNEGLKIRYGDVAPEAKENFSPSVTDKTDFTDLSQLQKYNQEFPNFGNLCEYGAVLLDGTAKAFPFYPESENMGLWSNSVSKADGTFETPIALTMTANGQYSSQGFTLTFDNYNNIFCNDLSITWYRDNEQLATADFTPNSAFYFCRKKVDNFNRVVMTFRKMNMPYNRLKLSVIDYGYGTYFTSKELRSANVIQELDPISAQLSINTVDFVLDSKTDMEYSFQAKQPLSVYFNGELRATTFVSKSQRTTKSTWKIESEDYIGQLSRLTFMGGMYAGANAKDLLTKIFTQAKIPFTIAQELNNAELTGYIPICDCREAVRQICFAIGAVCRTAESDKVNICVLEGTVKENIPLSRIRQGQSFEENDRITAVSLTAHNYKPTEEIVNAYRAEESGTGDDILVQFAEPLHDLAIKDGEILKDSDENLMCSANYAVIKANAGCVLSGKKYEDTVTVYTKYNPVVSASDLENVSEITDATLINPANAESVLSDVYACLIKRNITYLTIEEGYKMPEWGTAKWGGFVWGGKIYDDKINVGDVITAETEYLGTVTGRIISQRYNLNGGILAKECEMI